MFGRLKKIIKFPINVLHAKLHPVSYAKKIGVNIKGSVYIYGSSYKMFSAEPYLVSIGNNVYISVDARFICHDGSTLPFRDKYPDFELAGKIDVGDNVFIGTRAMILPGVSIGSNCIVGANSVVTRDVPNNTVVAGNPAMIIKTTDEFLEKALKRSLKIGHLSGKEKVDAYKMIFKIEK
ncbi:UDP-2-acetamido-3-amino-2, 3-dideoxy-D-glucuronate N-acetyltransferase [Vibrio cholerae]|nr:acyltransferase [Vibrio cholerae]BCN19605.1 putative acetyltransferase [Vibrio cholerae]BCN21381.1 putative acetyltransferase [Vibrio cholerae]GHX12381.1 UDP-2-acetamido-3-amino-2, 3-dideoxy-D-glucuronate N-acetyltransferase [Vibrio cholerae]GHY77449.1 UDP-2-acetamido-3-amino-2, 3-dideoxy-D-glucuronate N-acetyltransferase [Vibrio cholerae]